MTRLHTFLLVVLVGGFGSIVSASDRWETLKAINMVENPTNQTGYGSKGELGPYQFRSSTWRTYTHKSFQMANDRSSADQVAVKHYEWIKEHLIAAGIDGNSYNIALAWNCGLSAVLSGRVPMQSYQYADRVSNLAESFARTTEAEAPVVVVSTKTVLPASVVEFKIPSGNDAPEFKLVAEPFKFCPTAEPSRYVITSAASRLVLAVN